MKKHLIWILVAALAQGCASKPEVVIDEDPAAKAERLRREKEAAEAAARAGLTVKRWRRSRRVSTVKRGQGSLGAEGCAG